MESARANRKGYGLAYGYALRHLYDNTDHRRLDAGYIFYVIVLEGTVVSKGGVNGIKLT